MSQAIIQQIHDFSRAYGREINVQGRPWRYYKIGNGPALFWITGGLRRAAIGFCFMESLADRLAVIAPDLPPVMTFAEMAVGFEAILEEEQVNEFHLGGQSYGGLLAQGLLARRPEAVRQLLLSSTGPANYGKGWALVDDLFAFFCRRLPEKRVKNLLWRGLEKVIHAPEAEQLVWKQALEGMFKNDLTRADVVSHFAVAGDLFRRGLVRFQSYSAWQGRAVILSAENDPTQGKGDRARFEALFKRPVEWVSLGQMGHAALLLQPERFADLIFSSVEGVHPAKSGRDTNLQ